MDSEAAGSVPAGVAAAWMRLFAAEPDGGDRDVVVATVEDCRRVRAFADAVELRCGRRLRQLAAQGRSEPAESVLGRCGKRSSKEAAKARGREQVTEAMPGFESALGSGEVSLGHLDAIADATRRLDVEVRDEFATHQDELLSAAGTRSVEEFERECRDLAGLLNRLHDADNEIDELERQRKLSRIRRWVDKHTGMRHTMIELDPVRDATLHRVLRAHLRRIRHREHNAGRPLPELEIDALIAVVTAATGTDRATNPSDPTTADRPVGLPTVPEIGILISIEWLLGEAREHGICETYDGVAVPVSTVRRLCCDADIIPYVLGADGAVADMGRSTRTVTRAQRRRLRAMHRTCGGRNCHVPFEDCRIHHVRFWTRDRGPTDIDNLLPLCERCHHLVHEGHWTLTMTPDRVATWTRPDGTVHHTGTTIDRTSPSPAAPSRISRGRPPPEQAA